MKVFAADGRRWRLGRRRIAFRPRRLSLGGFVEAVEDPFGLVVVALFWILIYVPIVYVCAWIVALVWTPVIMLSRALRLARVRVVAYPLGLRRRDFPGTWTLLLSHAEAAETLQRAEQELHAHARPLCLRLVRACPD